MRRRSEKKLVKIKTVSSRNDEANSSNLLPRRSSHANRASSQSASPSRSNKSSHSVRHQPSSPKRNILTATGSHSGRSPKSHTSKTNRTDPKTRGEESSGNVDRSTWTRPMPSNSFDCDGKPRDHPTLVPLLDERVPDNREKVLEGILKKKPQPPTGKRSGSQENARPNDKFMNTRPSLKKKQSSPRPKPRQSQNRRKSSAPDRNFDAVNGSHSSDGVPQNVHIMTSPSAKILTGGSNKKSSRNIATITVEKDGNNITVSSNTADVTLIQAPDPAATCDEDKRPAVGGPPHGSPRLTRAATMTKYEDQVNLANEISYTPRNSLDHAPDPHNRQHSPHNRQHSPHNRQHSPRNRHHSPHNIRYEDELDKNDDVDFNREKDTDIPHSKDHSKLHSDKTQSDVPDLGNVTRFSAANDHDYNNINYDIAEIGAKENDAQTVKMSPVRRPQLTERKSYRNKNESLEVLDKTSPRTSDHAFRSKKSESKSKHRCPMPKPQSTDPHTPLLTKRSTNKSIRSPRPSNFKRSEHSLKSTNLVPLKASTNDEHDRIAQKSKKVDRQSKEIPEVKRRRSSNEDRMKESPLRPVAHKNDTQEKFRNVIKDRDHTEEKIDTGKMSRSKRGGTDICDDIDRTDTRVDVIAHEDKVKRVVKDMENISCKDTVQKNDEVTNEQTTKKDGTRNSFDATDKHQRDVNPPLKSNAKSKTETLMKQELDENRKLTDIGTNKSSNRSDNLLIPSNKSHNEFIKSPRKDSSDRRTKQDIERQVTDEITDREDTPMLDDIDKVRKTRKEGGTKGESGVAEKGTLFIDRDKGGISDKEEHGEVDEKGKRREKGGSYRREGRNKVSRKSEDENETDENEKIRRISGGRNKRYGSSRKRGSEGEGGRINNYDTAEEFKEKTAGRVKSLTDGIKRSIHNVSSGVLGKLSNDNVTSCCTNKKVSLYILDIENPI